MRVTLIVLVFDLYHRIRNLFIFPDATGIEVCSFNVVGVSHIGIIAAAKLLHHYILIEPDIWVFYLTFIYRGASKWVLFLEFSDFLRCHYK